MTEPRILRLYLEDGLRQSAEAGAHNFIARVVSVLRQARYRVEFRPNSPAERRKSATRRGYALFHMDGPVQARTLTFRRAYHYPFWFIERSGVRWDWPVARARFPADAVPRARADRFFSENPGIHKILVVDREDHLHGLFTLSDIERITQEQGPDILRLKGILSFKDDPERYVVQGVHMIVEGDHQRAWRGDEARESRLVFIGRHLDADALRTAFDACMA